VIVERGGLVGLSAIRGGLLAARRFEAPAASPLDGNSRPMVNSVGEVPVRVV